MDKYLIVLGVVVWWLYGLSVLVRFENSLTGLSFKQCMRRGSARDSVFFRHSSHVFFLTLLGPFIKLGFWIAFRISGKRVGKI